MSDSTLILLCVVALVSLYAAAVTALAASEEPADRESAVNPMEE